MKQKNLRLFPCLVINCFSWSPVSHNGFLVCVCYYNRNNTRGFQIKDDGHYCHYQISCLPNTGFRDVFTWMEMNFRVAILKRHTNSWQSRRYSCVQVLARGHGSCSWPHGRSMNIGFFYFRDVLWSFLLWQWIWGNKNLVYSDDYLQKGLWACGECRRKNTRYAEQLWQLCEGSVSEGPRVLMPCKRVPN